MVKFYVNKIKAGTINTSTGKAWTVEDVPKLWREKVRAEIEGTPESE